MGAAVGKTSRKVTFVRRPRPSLSNRFVHQDEVERRENKGTQNPAAFRQKRSARFPRSGMTPGKSCKVLPVRTAQRGTQRTSVLEAIRTPVPDDGRKHPGCQNCTTLRGEVHEREPRPVPTCDEFSTTRPQVAPVTMGVRETFEEGKRKRFS